MDLAFESYMSLQEEWNSHLKTLKNLSEEDLQSL